jgi:hypothetical protein
MNYMIWLVHLRFDKNHTHTLFPVKLATSLSQLAQIVFAQFAYQLRVSTFGGTQEQNANGVDIVVLNQDDGTIKAHRYLGLPPPSSYFVYDFLSPGSNLRVCALFHVTTDIINCKDITAGNNPAEFITLNESWFIMIRKVKENSIIIFNAVICEKFCCCASIFPF